MLERRGAALTVAFVIALASVGGALAVASGAKPKAARAAATRPPNVVFILTDDLAWNLVTPRYMPHLVALQRQGETFSRYIVTDSLCCPSRSSIFTGMVPHDTGVFKNKGAQGGYHVFRARGLESKTYAVAMQPRGYRTSFMGKYLNGYGVPKVTKYVPPGWNDWHGAGNGYPEFNYDLNENGTVVHYGPPPPPPANAANYMVDVLAKRASTFINSTAAARKPFVMEVATFAPHRPYTPAPRNARDFAGLKAPRTPSYDRNNINPPRWLGVRQPLTPAVIATIDQEFRMRAQSVEAVDALIGNVEKTLRARGLADNTYIVFSSDNGYHMGQHRLLPGKQTAFDSDIRVPLIVAGPGVPRGRTVGNLVQNIDLYPTFLQIAGARPNVSTDGHSLLPLLHPGARRAPIAWRTAALIEHRGPGTSANDPDFENGALGGNPTSYEAIRLTNAVYVEYFDGEREYYNIRSDPDERNNTYARLSSAEKTRLHATLVGLAQCHGTTGAHSCWAAGQPAAVRP